MDGFILKAAKRIKKEIPRKFVDLKISCDQLIGIFDMFIMFVYLSYNSYNYLDTLTELSNMGVESAPTADKYFFFFQSTIETGSSKLIEIALESILYLIGITNFNVFLFLKF